MTRLPTHGQASNTAVRSAIRNAPSSKPPTSTRPTTCLPHLSSLPHHPHPGQRTRTPRSIPIARMSHMNTPGHNGRNTDTGRVGRVFDISVRPAPDLVTVASDYRSWQQRLQKPPRATVQAVHLEPMQLCEAAEHRGAALHVPPPYFKYTQESAMRHVEHLGPCAAGGEARETTVVRQRVCIGLQCGLGTGSLGGWGGGGGGGGVGKQEGWCVSKGLSRQQLSSATQCELLCIGQVNVTPCYRLPHPTDNLVCRRPD